MVINDPPSTITEEWNIKDQSARATIGLALDDKLLILITNCETAKQTWLKLKSTYEHSNLTNKLFLLKKLYGSRYDAFKNMEEYLNSIKEIAERLRVIGETVKESHIIAVMLCGLPTVFDALITAIESRDEKEINLEYVCAKLRDEAARKENGDSPDFDQETAMATREKSGIGLRRGRIVCHLCGKEGHIRRNCDWNQHQNFTKKEGFSRRNDQCPPRENSQSEVNYINEQVNMVDLNEEWALSGTENPRMCSNNSWILDSGASAHMTPNERLFKEIHTLPEPIPIRMANGETVYATGKGDICLKLDNNYLKNEIMLNDVLLVPKLKLQLISVKRLCSKGFTVTFDMENCSVFNKTTRIVEGKQTGNVFIIETAKEEEVGLTAAACVHTWHCRLGHRGLACIKHMANERLVSGLNIVKCKHSDFCHTCQISSMTQRVFSPSQSKADKPFKVVVTDLCGPVKPTTKGGNRYFLTMTDQFSGFVQLCLLKNKHEAAKSLMNLIMKGSNQFGYFPNIVRSDGGGEYLNNLLDEFFKTHGISHQTTVSHTPQQNGQAERMNRTLLNEMRSLMKHKNLPLDLWGEIAMSSAYIGNLVESTSRHKTPHEMWFGRVPTVGHLRTIGSITYSHVPKSQRNKLDNTAKRGVLVGYGIGKKSYRLWLPGSNKIINATSVTFCEDNTKFDLNDNDTPNDKVI